MREGVRVAELRPEDDPATNQPVLESALFLVARSRIFPEEPSSAVPLLKGLFRTACRTGRPFDFNLVRHDLPLTEEDRLWLARKGGELFDVFMEQGSWSPGPPKRAIGRGWSFSFCSRGISVRPSRLEEERSWLEAVTADRLLRRAADSVELYRAYLGVGPVSEARVDEARVRLTGTAGQYRCRTFFRFPAMKKPWRPCRPKDLPADSVLGPRLKSSWDRIGYRRPTAAVTRRTLLGLGFAGPGCRRPGHHRFLVGQRTARRGLLAAG